MMLYHDTVVRQRHRCLTLSAGAAEPCFVTLLVCQENKQYVKCNVSIALRGADAAWAESDTAPRQIQSASFSQTNGTISTRHKLSICQMPNSLASHLNKIEL